MHLGMEQLSERGQEDELGKGLQGSEGAGEGDNAERWQTLKTGDGMWHLEVYIRQRCQNQCSRSYTRKKKFPELKTNQICVSKECKSYQEKKKKPFKKDTKT